MAARYIGRENGVILDRRFLPMHVRVLFFFIGYSKKNSALSTYIELVIDCVVLDLVFSLFSWKCS